VSSWPALIQSEVSGDKRTVGTTTFNDDSNDSSVYDTAESEVKRMMEKRMARAFLIRLFHIVRIVSPVILFLMLVIVGLGIAIAFVEGWTIGDGIYFAFVTGLTIGYGDLTAKRTLGRILAICIGFTGIVYTGVVVAVAVQALRMVLLDMYGDVAKLQVLDASYGVLNQARESREAKKRKKAEPKQ